MDILVTGDGVLRYGDKTCRAALGRGGIRCDKREGDGATPAGRFALRRVLYRPDRLAPPQSDLPTRPLAVDDGWCDAPGDENYNRLVRLPYAASAERLWRDDRFYDIVVVLGHNDNPVVAGAGSAVFFHLARADYAPTAGCVAVARQDMLDILAACGPQSALVISPETPAGG